MEDQRDEGQPRLRVTSVTIGTSQPHELAHFYGRLLGREVTADDPPVPGDPDRAGGWAQLGSTGPAAETTLSFEYERHFTPPRWPSTPGHQNATQHLDIAVDDLDSASAWAIAHGAVLAEVQPQEDVRVLIDPDGHPFCLFAAPDAFD